MQDLRREFRRLSGFGADEPVERQQDSLEFILKLIELLDLPPLYTLVRQTYHGALPDPDDQHINITGHCVLLDVPLITEQADRHNEVIDALPKLTT